MHEHLHKRQSGHSHLEKRTGETVHANIDGHDVSWTNNYGGAAGSSSPAAAAAAGSSPGTSVSPAPDFSDVAAAGDWVRKAFYDAKANTAEGMVHLGHYGDNAISGTFDT